MPDAIAGIDHVVVAVRDLEEAQTVWARLGFASTPRGRHVGRGTANYCLMFPQNYIELTGAAGEREGKTDAALERLERFLDEREGPMRLAFAPQGDPEAVRAALLRRGCHPSEPVPLARHIGPAEGDATLRFANIMLRAEDTPAIDSFICCHLTPEPMRRPEWLRHPNGAAGLRGIHVLVSETAGLLPAYDRLFGLPQVTTTDAVAMVNVGRQRIVFSTPDDFLTMHPGLDLEADFPLPGIVALEISVDRRDDTASYLAKRRIAFDEMPDKTLAVPAIEANGAILFFAEA